VVRARSGGFEAVKAKAQWAENHGFVWFSVMDHLIQISGVGAPDEPFFEGWTVLSALAAVTSRIRVATLATSVGYRNPAHLAKIAASVDLISRGRLTLGIGAGYLEAEYRQYGWEFPARPAVRIRQMAEAVRLILAMWTEKRTTFHGRYFHVEDAILEPKPVQKPHPPVLIAGGGEQLTLRAVARLADACNVGGDPQTVRHKLAVLRGHCDAAQRAYDAIDGKARAAGRARPVARFCRHRVAGDRSDWPIPRSRRAASDQQRLSQRHRNA
jgi:F420-dependent oxidoreductase-like protein